MVKDWTENDRTKQKPKTNKQSNKQKQGLENYMEKYVLKNAVWFKAFTYSIRNKQTLLAI